MDAAPAGVGNVPLLGQTFSTSFERGRKFFELSNHLGNVLVTVSDKKIGVDVDNNGVIDYYMGDVVSANDYAPFGMGLVGRKYSAGNGYKYGFNGQEKELELNENITSALYWEYDSRIARRWNVDPKQLVGESPYLVNGGNPVLFLDPLGDFRTKFGAHWYRLWHGGEVKRMSSSAASHANEWYVSKKIEFDDSGTDEVRVGVKRIFGWGFGQSSQNNDNGDSRTGDKMLGSNNAIPWMKSVYNDAEKVHGVQEGLDPTFTLANNALKYTGLSDPTSTAWCSAYACYTLHNAGFNQPKTAASRDWTESGTVMQTQAFYGAIAVFRNYADQKLTTKLTTGHIGFLYGKDSQGKYIILGGNQGNTLKFSSFSTTSGYIKAINGYMHLEGFYFPSNYAGPHVVAPVYQSSAKLNTMLGIVSKSNNTR